MGPIGQEAPRDALSARPHIPDYAASARYRSQRGSLRSTPRTVHAVPCGGRGVTRSSQLISCGVRSLLTLLQRRQQATRFSQESAPPRERGRMWSIVDAVFPQ